MTKAPALQYDSSKRTKWRLHPLALAVAMLAAPAWAVDPLTVPVQVSNGPWVSRGAATKVEVTRGSGQAATITQTITQSTKRAIYNWQSFDIGARATVDFKMLQGADSSALNRISNSVKVSEIYGTLKSDGKIFLINRNGVLFGGTAQVNTQGLFTSTLDIKDDVYWNGLADTVDSKDATFAWVDEPGLVTYDHPENYVKVEAGAEIKTASGGQVFLIAKKVENQGNISTPDGQAVMAAGDKVWLKTPTSEVIYASEANPSYPATRGLLVEVSGDGSVANLGSVLAQRGNITMVGYAVRNAGKLAATTSAQANGSVFLQARTSAQNVTDGPAHWMRSTQGGELTLDADSRIDITPDGRDRVDGNGTFTRSRIELSGQRVVLGERSQIKAPGAIVNVRAEDAPNYEAMPPVAEASGTARVIMSKGAAIDVSGTVDTQVSVARNFVTTELLGATDLKDAPLQKDGALYRSKVTLDIRDSATVIGHTKDDPASAYKKGIRKDANELLATGGNVTLSSTGVVVTHADSAINVSGGQVTYVADTVKPSSLLGADGKIYTANTATKDVKIVKVLSEADTDATRYGQVTAPAANTQGRVEAGYVEGLAGGTANIYAPKLALAGQIKADTVAGERQRVGKDKLAATSVVRLGSAAVAGNAILRGLTVSALNQSMSDAFWAAPLQADFEGPNRISRDVLNASRAGTIDVQSDGRVTIEDGAHLVLRDGGALNILARSVDRENGGVYLGGDIRGQGATVTVVSRLRSSNDERADITLKSGASIDVAGSFVNRQRDGADRSAALAGGNVTLSSDKGLLLADGSSIDVSGGATLSSAGVLTGTRAGAVVLESRASALAGTVPDAPIYIGAALKGQSLVTTSRAINDADRADVDAGKLRIKAGAIHIVEGSTGALIQQGAASDELTMRSGLFASGGFKSFDLSAVRRLDVAEGASVAPRVTQWMPTARLLSAGSGSRMDGVNTSVVQGNAAQAPTTSVKLSATGYEQVGSNGVIAPENGILTVGKNSQINVSPKGSVSLSGGTSLVVDGQVKAIGGKVTLDVTTGQLFDGSDATKPYVGSYRLGENALIDVSGAVLVKSSATGARQGEVLAGGSINLNRSDNRSTPLVISQGAVLKADGARGDLDVTVVTAGGNITKRQSISSDGGQINITTQRGGGVLAGTLQAKAGGDGAMGGSLTVNAQTAKVTGVPDVEAIVRLQQGLVDGSKPFEQGVVTVSTQAVTDGGFASLNLKAANRVELSGPVSLSMRRNLALDAPLLVANGAGERVLKAASVLSWTNSASDGYAQATSGSETLTLHGGLLDLSGQTATQGLKKLNLLGDDEVRMRSAVLGRQDGLKTAADVSISSALVGSSTGASYTLNAEGHSVGIESNGRQPFEPLSVGGSLNFQASTIEQHGVLWSPFGQISFSVTDSLSFGAGSLTSVSGNGLTAPYGQTVNGQGSWQLNGQSLSALPEKTITVNAPGKAIDVKEGATLDLSAGGQVLAWEFVAGPGGSKDVFTGSYDNSGNTAFAVVPTAKGYAPVDLDLLTNTNDGLLQIDAARQITFGPGGPVPAGTYTVLPARYALLPGAYLVRPSNQARMAQGQSVSKADGASLVGATLSTLGTGASESMARTFEVLPQTVGKRYSEIKESQADKFFTMQAASLDKAAPHGVAQGGALNLTAARLALSGKVLLKDGELNIAAGNIRVKADGTPTDTTFSGLTLTDRQLNETGAASLMLGGTRFGQSETAPSGEASTGARTGQVVAASVSIGEGARLTGLGDVLLVAHEQVQIGDGAQIKVTGVHAAESLAIEGDGASVRISGDAGATVVRQDTTKQPINNEQGDVQVGAKTVLAGAGLTVEATRSVQLSGQTTLTGQALTVGAARIVAGSEAGSALTDSGTQPLILTQGLTQQLSGAQRLTLRSYDSIDVIGQVGFGGGVQKSLVLDSASVRVLRRPDGGASQATLRAGDVTLTNTTGLQRETDRIYTAGSQLNIEATGGQGSTGQLTVGPGSVALSQAENVQLKAAGSVVFKSARAVKIDDAGLAVGTVSVPSRLSSSGSLSLMAQTVTTANAANAEVLAQDTLRIDKGTAGVAVASPAGAGGKLFLRASELLQAGTIAMPSGALTLAADGQGDRTTIRFAQGSVTDLSGQSRSMDGKAVVTPGGNLVVTATDGHIDVASQALIDVSAGKGSNMAGAGSIELMAPKGGVTINGELKGLSYGGQSGGSLTIDSHKPVNLTKLANTIAAQHTNESRNLHASLTVRQRAGDLVVAAGTTLKADRIDLSADSESLIVNGTLDAGGAQAGRIQLAAKHDVMVAGSEDSTARLLANASAAGAAGGTVSLNAAEGQIGVRSGSLVDVSAGAGGQGGAVSLRALRTQANDDVKVETIAGKIKGAASITVEGVKLYNNQAMIDEAFGQKVASYNTEFVGSVGQNASRVLDRLAAGDAGILKAMKLRAGVEVRNSGDITVLGSEANNGWNLSSFDSKGQVIRANGAPMNLVLRAGKDLLVQASISDGLKGVGNTASSASKINPLGLILDGEGADISLVAGSDFNAAKVTEVKQSADAGSVLIGREDGSNVVVRTTTGEIRVSAAGDIGLLNNAATVYTTGRQATTAEIGSYVAPATNSGNFVTGTAKPVQSLFLTQAGSVSLTAGRDVHASAEAPSQYASEWWWRIGGASNEKFDTAWFSRYDAFRQGVASFGGGNVLVAAGRDVRNLSVSSAGSGYQSRATGQITTFKGGNVGVQANGNVDGVFVFAGGDKLDVRAGSNIGATAQRAPLQVLYQDTAARIWARQNLNYGAISEAGTINPVMQAKSKPSYQLYGLAPNASMVLASAGADVSGLGTVPVESQLLQSTDAGIANLLPSRTVMAAPEGSIDVGNLVQASSAGMDLALLAGQNLSIDELRVTALPVSAFQVRTSSTLNPAAGLSADVVFNSVFANGSLEYGSRESVRLVAEKGSVSLGVVPGPIGGAVQVSNPVRVVAGKDITLKRLHVQHQADDELSLLQAGRDVVLIGSGDNTDADLKVHGDGDLVVAAGRHVVLNGVSGAVGGIGAVGNRENATLNDHSARVTVMAGTDLVSGKDYKQAISDYYHLMGDGSQVSAAHAAALIDFVQKRQRLPSAPTLSEAMSAFEAWPLEKQILFVNQVLVTDVRDAGRAAAALAGADREAAYAVAYSALQAVFPGERTQGNILMGSSAIKTLQDSSISLLVPGGGINVGQLTGSSLSAAANLGVVTSAGGDVNALVRDNIDVNQSRVFTVGKGDLMLWSSRGNVDAGRGAKTVTGAPPPVYRLVNGKVEVDTSGSFSGSGIAVLNPDSALDLFAPKGEISAGDAGIQSKGKLTLGAVRIVGADNIMAGGPAVGVPAAPAVGNAATNLGSLGQTATAAGNATDEDKAEQKKSRRKVLLELLGFGGEAPAAGRDCRQGVTQNGDCSESAN